MTDNSPGKGTLEVKHDYLESLYDVINTEIRCEFVKLESEKGVVVIQPKDGGLSVTREGNEGYGSNG